MPRTLSHTKKTIINQCKDLNQHQYIDQLCRIQLDKGFLFIRRMPVLFCR